MAAGIWEVGAVAVEGHPKSRNATSSRAISLRKSAPLTPSNITWQ